MLRPNLGASSQILSNEGVIWNYNIVYAFMMSANTLGRGSY